MNPEKDKDPMGTGRVETLVPVTPEVTDKPTTMSQSDSHKTTQHKL